MSDDKIQMEVATICGNNSDGFVDLMDATKPTYQYLHDQHHLENRQVGEGNEDYNKTCTKENLYYYETAVADHVVISL